MSETDTQGALFDVELPEAIAEIQAEIKLSAGRQRTIRRLKELRARIHPITRLPLHAEAARIEDRKAVGRRCGNCVHRSKNRYGFPKCEHPGPEPSRFSPRPYASFGAATDLPEWMPACELHEYRGERPEGDEQATRSNEQDGIDRGVQAHAGGSLRVGEADLAR